MELFSTQLHLLWKVTIDFVETVANETDAEEYLESSNIQNLIKEIKLQEEISRKKRLENQKQKNKKRIIMQKTVPNSVQRMTQFNEETDQKIEQDFMY